MSRLFRRMPSPATARCVIIYMLVLQRRMEEVKLESGEIRLSLRLTFVA